PADLFGGTWEALPAGYTLIAQGSGTDDFGSFNYVAGTKYGERMHKLTTDELPHIRGDVLDFARQGPNQKLTTHGVFSAPASIENVSFGSNPQSGQGDGFVMDFGKDVPHNNLSPCVAAYVWRRTA
uniref:phage baseplate protein n=1 Tax=Dysosmobacter sp. TaxID=2591382 RepID=UPI003AEFF352